MKKTYAFLFLALMVCGVAIGKELSVDIQLPVSEQNEALIALVAQHKNRPEDSEQTPEEFVAEKICVSMKDFIKQSVVDAHTWQTGESGALIRAQVLASLEANLTCSASFTEGN